MSRTTVNGYEIHHEASGGEADGSDVLWDRRNCYRSETRLDPYTLDDTIEDLRQLLEVARSETGGFEKPILIDSEWIARVLA